MIFVTFGSITKVFFGSTTSLVNFGSMMIFVTFGSMTNFVTLGSMTTFVTFRSMTLRSITFGVISLVTFVTLGSITLKSMTFGVMNLLELILPDGDVPGPAGLGEARPTPGTTRIDPRTTRVRGQ